MRRRTGNHQPDRVLGDGGGAGYDPAGIADMFDAHHIIHPRLGNRCRQQRVIRQMVGDSHHVVGVFGVRHGIAERATGRFSLHAADVAVSIRRRRRNERDIDVRLRRLDRPSPPAMRPEDDRLGQNPLGHGFADRAGNIIGVKSGNHATADMINQRRMHREDGTGHDRKIFQAKFRGGCQDLVQYAVAIAEMVMKGQSHAVPDRNPAENGFEIVDQFCFTRPDQFQQRRVTPWRCRLCKRARKRSDRTVPFDMLGNFSANFIFHDITPPCPAACPPFSAPGSPG